MIDYVARAEMLIRRPVAAVFDAFIDPDSITKFWLESTTGPLARGAHVKWQFMVPGATETVSVTAFQDQKHIAFDWSDGISVALDFEQWGDSATHLAVKVSGFRGGMRSTKSLTPQRASASSFAISKRCLKWGARGILLETKPS